VPGVGAIWFWAEEPAAAQQIRRRSFLSRRVSKLRGETNRAADHGRARVSEKSGIVIPTAGEATYDIEYNTLTIRAPKAAIQQVEELVYKDIGSIRTLAWS